MGHDPTLDATDRYDLVVAGAHLSGQPLNHELTERAAVLVASTSTAEGYRSLTRPPSPLAPVGRPRTGQVRQGSSWAWMAAMSGGLVSLAMSAVVM